MNRISAIGLTTLLLLGCDRDDFRNGYRPGELEVVGDAKVFHLSDGVFIEERINGGKNFYLIESTVADYELTAKGLDVELDGGTAGTYSTTPAPKGYVAAWITQFPDEGPEVTRFKVDDVTLAELLQSLTGAMKVRDIYNLKQ